MMTPPLIAEPDEPDKREEVSGHMTAYSQTVQSCGCIYTYYNAAYMGTVEPYDMCDTHRAEYKQVINERDAEDRPNLGWAGLLDVDNR